MFTLGHSRRLLYVNLLAPMECHFTPQDTETIRSLLPRYIPRPLEFQRFAHREKRRIFRRFSKRVSRRTRRRFTTSQIRMWYLQNIAADGDDSSGYSLSSQVETSEDEVSPPHSSTSIDAEQTNPGFEVNSKDVKHQDNVEISIITMASDEWSDERQTLSRTCELLPKVHFFLHSLEQSGPTEEGLTFPAQLSRQLTENKELIESYINFIHSMPTSTSSSLEQRSQDVIGPQWGNLK